ncbi:immunity 17 family protein [Roseofilum casamattae]|uniref:immunity 17 family protein n=1 Tax=Roseofilum casamattae TaxID=3082944 RepID=UPI003218DF83
MDPRGFVIVAVGAFSLAGAIFNWDWFMNSRKARFIVKILSRRGARIFYGLLGVVFIAIGVLTLMGIY